uniref:DUF7344 domain-containing protein n=1 Tax=Natronobacterium texcoconense TaxID=1095778 RepID=UPI001FCD8CA7|nr:hypothetical protein [Natronobacterium texcoconense]
MGRTEPATLTDLEQVILEHDQHASSEQERTIRIALIHKHVPKLEAAALLEYDSDRRLVTPTSTFERWQPQISTILEADPTLETPIRF